jgi:hypothetical protein
LAGRIDFDAAFGSLAQTLRLAMEPSIIALLTDALEDRPLEAVAGAARRATLYRECHTAAS